MTLIAMRPVWPFCRRVEVGEIKPGRLRPPPRLPKGGLKTAHGRAVVTKGMPVSSRLSPQGRYLGFTHRSAGARPPHLLGSRGADYSPGEIR